MTSTFHKIPTDRGERRSTCDRLFVHTLCKDTRSEKQSSSPSGRKRFLFQRRLAGLASLRAHGPRAGYFKCGSWLVLCALSASVGWRGFGQCDRRCSHVVVTSHRSPVLPGFCYALQIGSEICRRSLQPFRLSLSCEKRFDKV